MHASKSCTGGPIAASGSIGEHTLRDGLYHSPSPQRWLSLNLLKILRFVRHKHHLIAV